MNCRDNHGGKTDKNCHKQSMYLVERYNFTLN